MNISFKGLTNVERLADQQKGPTCWIEALENIIQFDNPGLPNDFSNYMRNMMIEAKYPGYIQEIDNVDSAFQRFPEILRAFGIQSDWYVLDHQWLQTYLMQNRGVLICGYPRHLARYYPGVDDSSAHAMVLTDSKYDVNNVLWYFGIDSNYPSQACNWSWNEIDNFANSYYKATGCPPLLVTRTPMRWPHRNT